jgi:hypothetical protein
VNLEKLTISRCIFYFPLTGLERLTNLHLELCNIAEDLNTNIFPCLRVLTMTKCSVVIRIYLVGNCLENFSLVWNKTLKLIDIQSSSLKQLSLKEISTTKPVKCILCHLIPKLKIRDCSIDLQLNNHAVQWEIQ